MSYRGETLPEYQGTVAAQTNLVVDPPAAVASTSKRPAEDAPASALTAKRTPNPSKTMPEYQDAMDAFDQFQARRASASAKRSAASPLISERVKVPRVEKAVDKPAIAKPDSTTARKGSSGWSKPATRIPHPGRVARQKPNDSR
ncbi:hypothetical protein B0H12DRAFT_1124461 [Mycena haematopus]|nr:hypothetical protein B0H12DRAFT_1124461 [Mycena haematopus]